MRSWTRSGAAQHGLDAGEEFADAERFGDVVVRAHGQADEGVDLVLAGGDDNDVAVGEGSDLAAYLDAIQPGQPQVEDDDVGGVFAHGLHPVGPGVDGRRGVPGPGQVGGDQPGQRGLVLDDQHPCRWWCGVRAHRLSLPAQERTSSTPGLLRGRSSSNLNVTTAGP